MVVRLVGTRRGMPRQGNVGPQQIFGVLVNGQRPLGTAAPSGMACCGAVRAGRPVTQVSARPSTCAGAGSHLTDFSNVGPHRYHDVWSLSGHHGRSARRATRFVVMSA